MAYADNAAGGIVLESSVPFTIISAAGVSGDVGTVLGVSSNTWVLALATVGTAIKGQVVALHKFGAAENVRVAKHAVIKGRYSGAAIGAPVYVAEGTSNGLTTQTKPTTTGDVNTEIGVASAADTVVFDIPNPDQQAVA